MEEAHPRSRPAVRPQDGDNVADLERQELFRSLYHELRRIAGSVGRAEVGRTLHPTALVHEAFMKIVRSDHAQWRGREHFLCAATKAMESVLCDYKRAAKAQKRGGNRTAQHLEQVVEYLEVHCGTSIEVVREALDQLSAQSPLHAQIVRMHFYAGCTLAEIGKMLGLSETQIGREWRLARNWLYGVLSQ